MQDAWPRLVAHIPTTTDQDVPVRMAELVLRWRKMAGDEEKERRGLERLAAAVECGHDVEWGG